MVEPNDQNPDNLVLFYLLPSVHGDSLNFRRLLRVVFSPDRGLKTTRSTRLKFRIFPGQRVGKVQIESFGPGSWGLGEGGQININFSLSFFLWSISRVKRSRWLLFFQTGMGIPVFLLMQCKFSIFSSSGIIKRNNVFLLDEESPAVFVRPLLGNRLTRDRW